jgi:hypothetical protein
MNNWDCVGIGQKAFVLNFDGQHYGLSRDLHITICYFPKGCVGLKKQIQAIAAKVISPN